MLDGHNVCVGDMYGHYRTLRIKMNIKLLTYVCSGDIPDEAFHTAAFIKKIDSLFDIFNSSSLLDSKLFKCAQREDSPSLYYIKMMRCSFNHLA